MLSSSELSRLRSVVLSPSSSSLSPISSHVHVHDTITRGRVSVSVPSVLDSVAIRAELAHLEDLMTREDREKTLERAGKVLGDRRERVRAMKTAAREVEDAETRQWQKEQAQRRKDMEKEREGYYGRQEEERRQREGEREKREREEQKARGKLMQESQIKQLQEYKEKIMKQRMDDYNEGVEMKKRVQQLKEEETQNILKAKENARIVCEQMVQKNEEIKKLKQLHAEEERLHQEKIDMYAKEKDASMQLRKEKEMERFNFKLAQRQKLIDEQSAILAQMQNGEERRLGNQIKEAEQRMEAKDKEDQEKRQLLKKSIAESRLKAEERKAREDKEKFEQEHRFLSKWKQSLADLENEDLQASKQDFQRNVQLQNELKAQILEKIASKNSDKASRDEFAKLIQEKNKRDDAEFLEYANSLIEEYVSKGKNTKPLLLQLARLQGVKKPVKTKQ